MKKIVLLVISLIFILPSFAYDTYSTPEDYPMFTFRVYHDGERFPKKIEGYSIGKGDFSDEHIYTLLESANFWSKYLKSSRNTPAILNFYPIKGMNNAFADSDIVKVLGETYYLTELNAVINDKVIVDKKHDYVGHIGSDLELMGLPFEFFTSPKPFSYSGLPNFYIIVIHELAHALGISSKSETQETEQDGSYGYIKDSLSLWDSNIRIYNTEKNAEIAPPVNTPYRTSKSTDQLISDFDIGKYVPYFIGENTIKVLGNNDDYEIARDNIVDNETSIGKGLLNYSIVYDNPKLVYGLPIHPGDGGDAELSHIELRNSLMSHQNYRNWSVFMEAELAALKDVGYNIDLRKHFGQSYYLNNQIVDNINGYYERNEEGTAYLGGVPSTVDYGIGLHIYGDNNQITQQADILSDGAAAIGARIDGVNNKLILDENYKIQTNGTNSIGLAVAYGKNHTINLKSNSSIIAEGINGMAASFDFGKNIMGFVVENQGSYIHQKIDNVLAKKGIISTKDVPVLNDTKGALVNNFNISGLLMGRDAAIYISSNAYVKNINIFKNAIIQGDIISEWNSVKDSTNATVQTPTGKILYTNLNFGLSSDENGDVINTPDATFDLIYDGNIYGKDTLKMNIKGGTLSFNGNAQIKSVTIDENANLKGIANYDVDTFLNLGTYTTSSNSSLDANEIINNGNINIGGNYRLKDNIKGNGNINVGYNDGGQVYGKLSLNDSITKINGTLTVNDNSEFSTINKATSVEIEKYVGMDNSKISFDLGDVFTLDSIEGNSDISQIKITSDDIENIKSGQNKFKIFDNELLTLNGTSHFYNNGRKYVITQDVDKKYLVVNDIAPATRGLNDAVTDASSANYIVSENEVQKYDGGTVEGNYFEITGADINFNNHKGLIVDGTKNNETYILTGIKNVSEGGDYKAAVTVKNNGYAQINSYYKDINISGTNSLNIDKTSTVNLITNNHDITIEGNIIGEKDNDNIATLALFGNNSIYLKGILDPLLIQVNTPNVYSSNYNDDISWILSNGILHFSNDKYLYDSTYHDGVTHNLNSINFDGGSLNIANGSANDIKLANMQVNRNSTVYLDVDLNSKKADKFLFDDSEKLVVGDTLNVVTNIVNNNIVCTAKTIKVPFISDVYKNENLLNNIEVSDASKIVNTPIYRYNLEYQNEINNIAGDFVLTRSATGTYQDYNPSIFASSVGAQVGTFLNQINTYDQAFSNMDMRMLMTREQRTAMKWANKFASIDNSKGLMSFTPNQIPEQYKGIWFNPYTTFEKVGLNNGPKVENIGYGTLVGGDTEIIELKHGWDAVYSAYIGYNGSHQNYDGVSIYQNGGTFGLTGTWYKGNFFTGLTANVGANVAEASTMFGSENFTTLGTGIASKTGYNWELANGKFIIQPSWLMSYTFVHTFDYRNAANVSIHSSPLNAIQLAPQLKFIGNLKNGWQPYAAIAMIWNIMDETKFKANNVNLPQMSVKPYVQYGLGLQKRVGERFTGYIQAMLRNGGRTGIALSLGLRWAIGK